jgi:hypothetical protein
LRFSNRLPPSGSVGDLHPSAVDHVRHTTKAPAGARADIRKLLKGLLLAGFSLGVFAPETLNTASCIHQLLLAGEERMAAGANFNMNIALVRGARSKAVSASAHYAHFVISGMDSCFHFYDDLDSEDIRFYRT